MTFKKSLPLAALVSAMVMQPVLAQEDQTLEPVVKVAQETNESAAGSQQRIDSITDQIDDPESLRLCRMPNISTRFFS